MIRKLTQTLLLAAFAFSATAYGASPVNIDGKGVAIHGYDPVAYFTEGKALKGSPKHSHKAAGATYHFKSAKHREQFAKNPAKYTPQFGGYCAMGTAMGKKLDVDPEAWRIVDGKLYLNLNKDVQTKWLSDLPGHLKQANEKWPDIRDKDPASL
jgi:YHS domain-containing protein